MTEKFILSSRTHDADEADTTLTPYGIRVKPNTTLDFEMLDIPPPKPIIPLAKQPRFIGSKKDGSDVLLWLAGMMLIFIISILITIGLSNV